MYFEKALIFLNIIIFKYFYCIQINAIYSSSVDGLKAKTLILVLWNL